MISDLPKAAFSPFAPWHVAQALKRAAPSAAKREVAPKSNNPVNIFVVFHFMSFIFYKEV